MNSHESACHRLLLDARRSFTPELIAGLLCALVCFGSASKAQNATPEGKDDLSDRSEYERQIEIGRRATESGDLDKARKLFQDLSLQYPSESKVLLCLARVYYRLAKRDRALVEQKTAELAGKNAEDARKLEHEIADLQKQIAQNEQMKSEIMTQFKRTLPPSDRVLFEKVPSENNPTEKVPPRQAPLDLRWQDRNQEQYEPSRFVPRRPRILEPGVPDNST